MAIKAVVPGRTKDYVSKQDVAPPKDDPDFDAYEPTVWPLKALDSRVLGMLKDKNGKITIDTAKPNDEIGTVFNQNEYAFQVVQFGLDKPKNFLDPQTGEEIRFSTVKRNLGGKSYEIAAEDFVAKIPNWLIAELADEIENLNVLTASEGNG